MYGILTLLPGLDFLVKDGLNLNFMVKDGPKSKNSFHSNTMKEILNICLDRAI